LQAVQIELAHREDEQLGAFRSEPLRHGVELADRLDRIRIQLQANRVWMGGGVDVDDAAPHAELAPILDQADPPITPLVQLDGEPVAVHVVSFDEVVVASGERSAGRDALGD
jgi:hypothetical protein